jgi:hypothetical protein
MLEFSFIKIPIISFHRPIRAPIERDIALILKGRDPRATLEKPGARQ